MVCNFTLLNLATFNLVNDWRDKCLLVERELSSYQRYNIFTGPLVNREPKGLLYSNKLLYSISILSIDMVSMAHNS